MAKLGISTGTTPNDGTGDSMLSGAVKINSNFNELYTLLGNGTNLSSGIVTSIVAGTGVTISGATGQVTINSTSSGIATYATSSGIATYATNAGTSTSVIGGIGSITSLTVSGITTTTRLNVGTGGTVITTTATGLVGIGTTDPTNTLTVYGPNATIRINDTASNASTTIAYGSITLNSNGVIQQIGDTQYFRAGQSGSSSYLFDNYYSGFSHELFYIDTYGSIRAAGNAKITGITTTATLNVGTGATIAQFDGNSYSIPGGTSTSNGVILKHQQNTKLSTTSTGISVGDQLIINSTPSTTRFTSYGPNIYGSGDFYFKCNIGGSGDTGTDILYISSSGASILGNTYTNQLTVGTGGTVITTTATGLVGIGTTNPTSTLTVRGGDISVGINTSQGVILTSPDGTKYRLFVENGGTLKTVVVP